MTVQQVSFVPVSDVFAGLSLANDVFNEQEVDASWGDNTRTLVQPEVVADALKNGVEFEEEADLADGDETDQEVWAALDRLKGLPAGVLVDLEN